MRSKSSWGMSFGLMLRLRWTWKREKTPPSMIPDIAASLHLVWSTLGTEAFQRLLLLALGDEHDAFPKAKTTMEDKTLWVNSLTTDTARMDARVFKRLLKAFFGGKKVGSNL